MAADPGSSSAAIEHDDVRDDLPLSDDAAADGQVVVVPSTVKMKLTSFCPSKRLRARLQTIVLDINRLVGEAYCFANLHILRLLVADKPLPVIDRNFYYRCLVGVADSDARKGTLGPEYQSTMDVFDGLRPEGMAKVDIRAYNQVVADQSISMATMATNHLWTNLQGRLLRYLRWRHPGLKRHHRSIVNLVACYPKKAIEADHPAAGVISALRALLPLPSGHQYASRAHLTIPLYTHLLRETELHRPRRGRTFTLLPMKAGYTIGNVPISNMMLMTILRRLGMASFSQGYGTPEEHRVQWHEHFNLRLVESCTRQFDHRILTDGCTVSALMAKSSCLVCPMHPIQHSFSGPHTRFCGVDGGFTDVVTAAWTDGKTTSYSSARYYEAAHYNVSRRRVEAWNRGTEALAREVPSAATCDMERLLDHTQTYILLLPKMLEHRALHGYRNMRFLRYQGKQRAIQDICDTLAPPGVPTVIGFGDWSGGHSSPISRRCAGPLQEIKHELAARENVELHSIGEYKTSITCHCCWGKLQNMKATSIKVNKDGTREAQPRHKIHKVLHCKPSGLGDVTISRCGHTWNRDVNAAKNMLMLLMLQRKGWQRPDPFCRPAAAAA